MPMTVAEAAAALNGKQYPICEYDTETKALLHAMKDARLVAVYGHSDDIMMFAGSLLDEFYGETWIGTDGETGETRDAVAADIANLVTPLWCKEPDISWTYGTTIPHETFLVMEDETIYCRGLVFSLDYLEAAAA